MQDEKRGVKGETTMKDRKAMKSGMMLLLIFSAALAISMASGQITAWAQVNCNPISDPDGDPDQDGFTNSEECNGIMLANSTDFFPGKNSAYERPYRLDPDSKDLFVILVPAPGGYFSTLSNPLEFVTQATGGLPITLHTITENQATPNRFVSSSSQQKAIRIIESLDTSNSIALGQAPVGTPNSFNDSFDQATIYTQNIIDNIELKCGARVNTSRCADTAGAYGQELVDKYIKHTIAHETGHMVVLRYLDLSKSSDFKTYMNIGNHYPTGTSVLLDQSVKFTDKSGKVTFYLGTVYTSPDQANFKIVGQ
jgi:hypothetical protein